MGLAGIKIDHRLLKLVLYAVVFLVGFQIFFCRKQGAGLRGKWGGPGKGRDGEKS